MATPLTSQFLVDRGECCGNGCVKCPYDPRHTKGCTELSNYEKMHQHHILCNSIVIDMIDSGELPPPGKHGSVKG